MFGTKKYDGDYDRMRYDMTFIFSHYFAKIKVDFKILCLWKKKLTLHNAVIIIKSIFNKDKNNYYYKIFLEKCSYQLAKK